VNHPRQCYLPWLRGLGVVVAALVLYLTFRELDLAQVSEVLRRVDPLAIPWVLAPMGAALTLESLGWAWAFWRSGHAVPFWGLWRVRVTSEALAMTLPAGMLFCESTKPFLLARHCGLSTEVSVAGMAVRKYLLLISQAVYISAFALLGAPFLERASNGMIGRSGLALGLLGVGGVVLCSGLASGITLRDGRIAERIRHALARLPLTALRRSLERSRGRFASTDGELRHFFRGPLLSASSPALLFLASWMLEAVETYLILRLFGVDLPFEAVAAVEVALSFLRHITFILPAGLGVQDLGYVAFLRALGVADPLAIGAAFVLTKRAKECAWALVGYSLFASDLRATSGATAAPGGVTQPA
jgi:glycosyltransferase 2 family protein